MEWILALFLLLSPPDALHPFPWDGSGDGEGQKVSGRKPASLSPSCEDRAKEVEGWRMRGWKEETKDDARTRAGEL